MRFYTGRTNLDDLENTVMIGLKGQPHCLISTARIEESLRGLGETLRAEWLDSFCRSQGLSAETVDRGMLFTRLAVPITDG